MIHLFWEAFQGMIIVKKIFRKFHITKNDLLLILPDNNIELLNIVEKYLKDFCEKKYLKKIYLISESGVSNAGIYNKVEIISHRKMMMLLRYYNTWMFFDNMVIVSLKYPFSRRNLSVMMDNCSLTLEDIVTESLLL